MKIICFYCHKDLECHPEEFKKLYKEECMKKKWREQDKDGKIIRLCSCFDCIREKWIGIEKKRFACHP